MNINFAIAAFGTFIICCATGTFVLIKSPKRTLNRFFSGLSFSTAVWAFGIFMHAITAGTPEACLFWGRFAHIGASYIPIFFLLFILEFVNAEKRYLSVLSKTGLTLATGFAVFSFHERFFTSVSPKVGLEMWADPGALYPVFIIYFSVWISVALFMLLSYQRRQSSSIKKIQAFYILSASLIGFLGGSSTFFTVYGIEIPFFTRVGLYPVALYNFIIAYAIVRYRLLGIKIIAIRTTIFLIVYMLLFSFPVLLGIYFRDVLEKLFPHLWWFIPGLFMSLVAVLGFYLFLYLNRKAEEQVRTRKLNYLSVINSILSKTREVCTLEELMDMVLGEMTDKIDYKYAAFYLKDKAKESYLLKRKKSTLWDHNTNTSTIGEDNLLVRYLERTKEPIIKAELNLNMAISAPSRVKALVKEMEEISASVVIPGFYQKELIVFIVLFDNERREIYDDEDVRAFNSLGNNVALAVKNALFVEELNTVHSDLIAAERMASIGRLATSAKHEISNPLNVVYGSFQQVLMDLKDKEKGFEGISGRLVSIREDSGEILRVQFPKEGKVHDDLCRELDAVIGTFERNRAKRAYDALSEELKAHKDRLERLSARLSHIECDSEDKKTSRDELVRRTVSAAELIEKVRTLDGLIKQNLERGFTGAQKIARALNAIYHLPKELEEVAKGISLNELIEASFDFAGYQSYWENLSDTVVEKRIPEDLPKIKGHFNRLVNVFSNLIINAYQAMTEAGLKERDDRLIRIEGKLSEMSPGMVEVNVANKGKNIDEESLEQIFKQGYSTKGGLGVGLEIAKTQVEVFNKGRIFARNIKGFGPEFVIEFPVWDEGPSGDEIG